MNGFIKSVGYPTCMKLGQQYRPRALSLRTQKEGIAMSSGPCVSIVVPSFNQAQYLEATLDSLFAQNYSPLEVIVMDGGSTDGSVDILKRYDDRLSYWESVPDEGQTHAINKGFARANGEILAWLNSDDLLLPGAIKSVVERFEKAPSVDVVYGQRIIINEHGQDIGTWNVKNAHNDILPYADFVPQETLFWRKSLWKRVGGTLDQSFKFAMDWDLLLRFKLVNAKFSVINRYQGAFRFHSQQKTVCEIGGTGFSEMELLRNRWAQQCGSRTYNKRRMTAKVLTFMLVTRLWELTYGVKA